MLRIGVKFCGGCNPRYDRAAAFHAIRAACADAATFEGAKTGESYDVLLIIRGCTQCQYLYEEIGADVRIVHDHLRSIDTTSSEIRSIGTTQRRHARATFRS